MSFALITDEALVAWDDGKLDGSPPWAVSEAEDALREQEVVGATPTGPWFERGTAEHAWIVLRKLAPEAEVGGEPPALGGYGDELDGEEPLVEANYVEGLHPRDRLGRWREKIGSLHEITKADVIAGKVPGFKHDPNISPGIAAHMRAREHVTLGPAAFEGEKLDVLLMTHEFGHAVQQHLFATLGKEGIDKIPEVQAFRREGQTFTRGVGYAPAYDNPFGASERPEEMVADAYSELLFQGLRGSWEALPGERVVAEGYDEPGEVERVFHDRDMAEVRFPGGKVEQLSRSLLRPAEEEPTDEFARKRWALLKLVQKAAGELGLPNKRIYRHTPEGAVRIEEGRYVEGLHPRDRRGRWRRKLGGTRLALKGAKKLSEKQVIAKAQKVADGLTDFYGGDRVEVHYEPEYLATVGSDARFRHEGQAASGLLIGTRIMERTRDPEMGVEMLRIVAHEAAHSLSPENPLPGISQTVEEGGAEVLSLWWWQHRSQPFDERDATRREGRWTAPGVESLTAHVVYRDDVIEVIKRAASKVGWDREEIVDEVLDVMGGEHYDRIRWRDETTREVAPPEGVPDDVEGLVRWLLDEGLQEADYIEGLHPRDRRGRWRKKEVGFATMLRQTMSMKAATVAPSKLHYMGFEDMVLKHGLLFEHGPGVTPTEREYSATTPKECFTNALHAALEHPDLTYVEGFAYNGLLPIHHAWLVDDDGIVHDPTWASIQGREGTGDIYVGIPFQTWWVMDHVMQKGTYGVYGDWGEGLRLEEPIPEEAIETGVKGEPVPKELQDPDPQIMGVFARAKLESEGD